MPSLRLSDADRARLGIETEWLPLDAMSVTNKEAIMLRSFGYNTPTLWRLAPPCSASRHRVGVL